MLRFKSLILLIVSVTILSSCMVVDGSTSYRKNAKCCGLIKCDMHRQMKKHKRVVTGHKSLRKREAKIKRGY